MISLFVAIQKKDRGIGLRNELLFRIPDDLKRFKALTMGHPIIMGRKTFDSIGRPLPGRTNIVITRQNIEIPGVVVTNSLEDALLRAREIDETIFVIGGAEIYKHALPFADRLYVTEVESNVPSDTFFPDYSEFKKVFSKEEHLEDILPYTFIILEK